MTEHTHENINGTAPDQSESEDPQITLPPAEIYIQQMRSKIAELTIENFEFRSAAQFQAQLAQGYQREMVKLSEELSQLKGDSQNGTTANADSNADSKPTAISRQNRTTRRATPRKK